jgi:azurin
MRSTVIFPIVVVFAALGCNKGATTSSQSQPQAPTTAAADPMLPAAPTPQPDPPAAQPTATATGASDEAPIEIQLATVGENMQYDTTTLKVPTGKKVHITLKNNGHSDLMPHNWVLVNPGTQAQVALAGVDKKADGYLVEGPDVLAHTPLAPPQKTAEVTFTAPAPGEYPYICTVPGHYMLMKGMLTVTP